MQSLVLVMLDHTVNQVLPVGWVNRYMEVHILQVESHKALLSLERWNDGGKQYHSESEVVSVFVQSI